MLARVREADADDEGSNGRNGRNGGNARSRSFYAALVGCDQDSDLRIG